MEGLAEQETPIENEVLNDVDTEESETTTEQAETEELETEQVEGDKEEVEEVEETVFQYGEESVSPADEESNSVIRGMRKELKEASKVRKELEAKLQNFNNNPVVEELPPVPNQYDFDTDEDFNKALTGWIEKRDEINTNKQARQAKEAEFKKVFDEKNKNYITRFDEISKSLPAMKMAHESVISSMPVNMQNELLMESEKPAEVVLALGSNPELLEKYMSTNSPIARGRLLAEIESKANVRTQKRKTNVSPSTPNAGAASTRGVEAAIEKARKSGDYTKVLQLKRQLNK